MNALKSGLRNATCIPTVPISPMTARIATMTPQHARMSAPSVLLKSSNATTTPASFAKAMPSALPAPLGQQTVSSEKFQVPRSYPPIVWTGLWITWSNASPAQCLPRIPPLLKTVAIAVLNVLSVHATYFAWRVLESRTHRAFRLQSAPAYIACRTVIR